MSNLRLTNNKTNNEQTPNRYRLKVFKDKFIERLCQCIHEGETSFLNSPTKAIAKKFIVSDILNSRLKNMFYQSANVLTYEYPLSRALYENKLPDEVPEIFFENKLKTIIFLIQNGADIKHILEPYRDNKVLNLDYLIDNGIINYTICKYVIDKLGVWQPSMEYQTIFMDTISEVINTNMEKFLLLVNRTEELEKRYYIGKILNITFLDNRMGDLKYPLLKALIENWKQVEDKQQFFTMKYNVINYLISKGANIKIIKDSFEDFSLEKIINCGLIDFNIYKLLSQKLGEFKPLKSHQEKYMDAITISITTGNFELLHNLTETYENYYNIKSFLNARLSDTSIFSYEYPIIKALNQKKLNDNQSLELFLEYKTNTVMYLTLKGADLTILRGNNERYSYYGLEYLYSDCYINLRLFKFMTNKLEEWWLPYVLETEFKSLLDDVIYGRKILDELLLFFEKIQNRYNLKKNLNNSRLVFITPSQSTLDYVIQTNLFDKSKETHNDFHRRKVQIIKYLMTKGAEVSSVDHLVLNKLLI